jgi:hypothetical protein
MLLINEIIETKFRDWRAQYTWTFYHAMKKRNIFLLKLFGIQQKNVFVLEGSCVANFPVV